MVPNPPIRHFLETPITTRPAGSLAASSAALISANNEDEDLRRRHQEMLREVGRQIQHDQQRSREQQARQAERQNGQDPDYWRKMLVRLAKKQREQELARAIERGRKEELARLAEMQREQDFLWQQLREEAQEVEAATKRYLEVRQKYLVNIGAARDQEEIDFAEEAEVGYWTDDETFYPSWQPRVAAYQELPHAPPRETLPVPVRILLDATHPDSYPYGRVVYTDDWGAILHSHTAHTFAEWEPWPVKMRGQLVYVSERARMQSQHYPDAMARYVYAVREHITPFGAGPDSSSIVATHTALDDANVLVLNRVECFHPVMADVARTQRYFRKLRFGQNDYEEVDGQHPFERVLTNDVFYSHQEMDNYSDAWVAWYVSQHDGTLMVSGYDWGHGQFVVIEVVRELIS